MPVPMYAGRARDAFTNLVSAMVGHLIMDSPRPINLKLAKDMNRRYLAIRAVLRGSGRLRKFNGECACDLFCIFIEILSCKTSVGKQGRSMANRCHVFITIWVQTLLNRHYGKYKLQLHKRIAYRRMPSVARWWICWNL